RRESSLSEFSSALLHGDIASAGVGLQGRGVNGVATADLSLDSVPEDAEVQAAYLYWAGIGLNSQGKLNDTAITGVSLGTNRLSCDSPQTIEVFRADVLAALPREGARVSIRKPTKIELPDSGAAGVAPSALGASLVVI